MNPENPQNSPENLEASLTALILGELPADQAFALGRAIEHDAELHKLYERLKQTVHFVKQATAKSVAPANEAAPMRLSEGKRQQLLQKFKTVQPREFAQPKRRRITLVELAAVLVIVAVLASMMLPSLAKSKARASRVVAIRRDQDKSSETETLAETASPVPVPSDGDSFGANAEGGKNPKGLRLPIGGLDSINKPAGKSGNVAIVLPGSQPLDLNRQGGVGGGGGQAGQATDSLFDHPAPTATLAGNLGESNPGNNKTTELLFDTKGIRGESQSLLRFKTSTETNPALAEDKSASTPASSDQFYHSSPSGYKDGATSTNSLSQGSQIAAAEPIVVTNTFYSSLTRDDVGGLRYLYRVEGDAEKGQSANLSAGALGSSRGETKLGLNGNSPTAQPESSVSLSTGLPVAKAEPTTVADKDVAAFRRRYGLGPISTENEALNRARAIPSVKPATSEEKRASEVNRKAVAAKPGLAGIPQEGFRAGLKDKEQTREELIALDKQWVLDESAAARVPVTKSFGIASGGLDLSNGKFAGTPATPSVAQATELPALTAGSKVEGLDRLQEKATKAPATPAQAAAEDGKLLFQQGKLDEAEVKLKEVRKVDPQNETAYYYLNAIQDSRFSDALIARDIASRKALGKVESAWITPNAYARTNLIPASKRAEAISNKLDRIRLDTLKVEGQSLGEIVSNLSNESRKRDPEKRGVNIIILPGKESVAQSSAQTGSVEQSTGLPIPAAAPNQSADISTLTGNGAAMSDVRLGDALDSIVQAIGSDKIKYSIEDYAIVFSAKDAESGQKLAKESVKQREIDVAPAKPAVPPPIPQPEILTRENAFSTFSLNVSDVSFKLAEASLEKAALPEAASIRSEEFINAFDYRDPEPAPGAAVAFASERSMYPFAQNRDLLRFSIKTAAQGRSADRPLNLVLLLDNSGSMERADRVRIIHEALRVLASQLRASDTFSVVTFARTATLRVDGVSGDQAGKVADELSDITPQGGTNLEEAMNLAYQTALRHYSTNGINRVVLLTDGAANLGNVDPATLKQKVETERKQGVALDCFGIGWDGYNDDLLESLSRNGDGRYGFINSPEAAATEFAPQLAGALHVAAADVKTQVEFNPNRVTAYRQIGYAKHQLTKEQFRDNTVDAAEIGAAESGNALYVIETNPRGEGPIATVRVRYRVPGTQDFHEQEWTVPYSGNALSLEQSSPAMRLASVAGAFSELLASNPYAGEISTQRLLNCLRGTPDVYGADARPKKLESMIRQAGSLLNK